MDFGKLREKSVSKRKF